MNDDRRRNGAGDGRRKSAGGFTLVEMLVVIMIVVLVAGASVAMLNVFFRGQGVRQGAMLLTQAFTRGKQLSATSRKVHFLVFTNAADGGRVTTYADTNGNHVFDGDQVDLEIDEHPVIDLPSFVDFAEAPKWVGIEPNGYCTFNPGFKEISSGRFEGEIKAGHPVGDIILQLRGKSFKMCMDIERPTGKIRKSHFFAE